MAAPDPSHSIMGLERLGEPMRIAAAILCILLGTGAAAQTRPGDAPKPPSHPAEAGATSAEACRQRTIRAVQERYEGIRDIRARFVQTARAAAIGTRPSEPVTSRGSVVVSKPSRMRWSYETPEPSLVISDGKTLWIYDPTFGEAQRLPVGGGFLSGAALQFLLGQGDLEREFTVRLVACETRAVELELRPREPTSYEKLYLVVDPSTGNVSRTRIDDLLGNSTVVEFADVEINLDPPGKLFHFDPPAGVRVIELPAPAP